MKPHSDGASHPNICNTEYKGNEHRRYQTEQYSPLKASDSDGMSLFAFEGVCGPPSSNRW